ncbi:MAG: photosystem II stability/assembly factor-like uncharacterized protein [Paraglaciecola sp.]|jgi:photosystem II stability/assembly factor-like uncharacterized protein
MRSKLACLTTALIFYLLTPAHADVHSYQAPLVKESLLLDIAKSGDRLIAVGERGHILLSDDGVKWEQVVTPSLATLTAVHFVGAHGWAVGHDASILKSEDAGKSWQLQYFDPQLERPFLDVIFFDQQHGIAIGAYGAFYRTTDAGLSWKSELHPEFLSPDDQAYLEEMKLEDEEFYLQELSSILPHLNSVSSSAGRLYLAGEAGLLASSDDQGRSWKRMEIDYFGSFFDFAQTLSGRIFAAGLRGNLFEYLGSEQQWLKLETGSKSSLNAVISIDPNTSMVLGNNGAMVTISPESIGFKQFADGKAIVAGLMHKGQLIVVSGTGIKHIQMEP